MICLQMKLSVVLSDNFAPLCTAFEQREQPQKVWTPGINCAVLYKNCFRSFRHSSGRSHSARTSAHESDRCCHTNMLFTTKAQSGCFEVVRNARGAVTGRMVRQLYTVGSSCSGLRYPPQLLNSLQTLLQQHVSMLTLQAFPCKPMMTC